jgi:PAS domain S-box-containing protein
LQAVIPSPPFRLGTYRKLFASSGAARTLSASVVALVLAAIALTAWDLKSRYTNLYESRLQTLTLLNNSISEQIERDIQAVDLVLQSAQRALLAKDGGRLRSGEAANELFLAYRAGLPFITNIGYAGPDGFLRAIAIPVPPELSDLSKAEIFSYPKDHPGSGLHISAPSQGVVVKLPLLGFSRPIIENGAFVGVIGATVSVDHFTNLQQTLIPVEGAAAAIVRRDGVLLSRYPPAPQLVGKDLSNTDFFRIHLKHSDNGMYRALSQVDGIERTFVYRSLTTYPLIVNVSLDERALFAPWLASAKTEIATAALGIAIILLLALLILRQMHAAMEQNVVYETILEAQSNAGEGMVIAEGVNLVHVNDAVAAMLGYTPKEIAAMKTLRDIIHPDEIESVIDRARRRAAGEGLENRYASAVRAKDGRRVDVEVVIATMNIGGRLQTVAIARDITDRLRAENEVKVLNRELEQRVRERTAELETANKELETFNYSVSHDLSGPARRIAGFSTLLLSDYSEALSQPVKNYLRRISLSAQRMGELIDDLLTLSRVSRMAIRETSVDLSDMARTITTDLVLGAPERKVEISIQEGVIARGDARLLRIVLDNLLGNAFKYTSKCVTAKIEFGQKAGHNGADTRVFHVADNGAGFEMQHAEKLFEPFERLHSASEFEGSGIGLATAYRVISRHRGRIWAEARPGEGAIFYFTLG